MSLNRALLEGDGPESDMLPFVVDEPIRQLETIEREVKAISKVNQSWMAGEGVVYADYYALGNEGSTSTLKFKDHLLLDDDDNEEDDFFEVEQGPTPQLKAPINKITNTKTSALQPLHRYDILASLITDPIGASSALSSKDADQLYQEACKFLSQHRLLPAVTALEQSGRLYLNHAKAVMNVDLKLAKSFSLVSRNCAQRAQAIRLAARLYPPNKQENQVNTKGRHSLTSTGDAHNLSSNVDHSPKQSALRDVVRDALQSSREEDISASIFLGSVADARSEKKASDNKAKKIPANPIDDMLQLEKELKSMDMSLSIQTSIAKWAATNATKVANKTSSLSHLVSQQTSQQPRPGQIGFNRITSTAMDSSWWGNASCVSTATNYTSLSNGSEPSGKCLIHTSKNAAAPGSVHPSINPMTASISSWATSSTVFVGAPVLPLSTQNYKNLASTVSTIAQIHTGSQSSHSNTSVPPHPNTNVGPGTANAAPSTNTKQLLRLLDSLKTLGDENAALLQQMEEVQRTRVEAAAMKEEMKLFQRKYHERFQNLKSSLEEMYKKQEPGSTPSNSGNVFQQSKFLQTQNAKNNIGTTRQQFMTMEAQIQSLSQQLSKMQADAKKKDSQLKKYETFYKEVKARSAQRAAERQKVDASAGLHRPAMPTNQQQSDGTF